ncbi:MAG TPA: hypothetical protein DIT94_04455 [Deltaproteobacteria bacterium]|nr:hypothetical protein [Deltaproteobacteria bacterium]
MKSFVSTENNQSFARHLRQALPYFEEFQGQILVFHLGVFPAPEEGSRIIEDLVLLNRAGLQIILVHGPGEPSIFSNSPSESHFNEIRRSIASANWELQTRIHSISQKVQTFSAHLIKAVPSEIHPEERRLPKGRVSGILLDPLHEALNSNKLIIIPSFGIGEKGRLWLLDSWETSIEVASAAHAKKLVHLGTQNQAHFSRLPSNEMNTSAMRLWLEQEKIPEEAGRVWQGLLNACERGVERCHDLDSGVDGSLLQEILTPGGIGLMVTNSDYRRIRSARMSDLQRISELLGESSTEKTVVYRSREYLGQHVDDFHVFCIDEEITGCVEFHTSRDSPAALIGSLTVSASHRNQGIGRELVEAVIQEAQKREFRNLFALTMSQSSIFVQCGFEEVEPEELPDWKLKDFDYPESRVFRFKINRS